MKRVYVLLLTAILILPLISAANETDNRTQVQQEMDNARDTANDVLGPVGKAGEKADDVLEKPIVLPGPAKKFMNAFFRLKEDPKLSHFIMILCVFLVFFFVFLDMFNGFSPFQERTCLVMAIVFTAMISITGTINGLALYLSKVGEKFALLQESQTGALAFGVIALFLCLWAISNITRHFRKEKEKKIAEEEGWGIGLAIGTVNAIKTALGWMAGATGGGNTYRTKGPKFKAAKPLTAEEQAKANALLPSDWKK